jgi:hypothetical protein
MLSAVTRKRQIRGLNGCDLKFDSRRYLLACYRQGKHRHPCGKYSCARPHFQVECTNLTSPQQSTTVRAPVEKRDSRKMTRSRAQRPTRDRVTVRKGLRRPCASATATRWPRWNGALPGEEPVEEVAKRLRQLVRVELDIDPRAAGGVPGYWGLRRGTDLRHPTAPPRELHFFPSSFR